MVTPSLFFVNYFFFSGKKGIHRKPFLQTKFEKKRKIPIQNFALRLYFDILKGLAQFCLTQRTLSPASRCINHLFIALHRIITKKDKKQYFAQVGFYFFHNQRQYDCEDILCSTRA